MVNSITAETLFSAETTLFDSLIWLDTKEAAKFLRRSIGQIRNMVYRGQLKARRFHGRLLFKKSELHSQVENSSF